LKIFIGNIPTSTQLENGNERYFIKAGSRWPFSVTKKRESKLRDYLPFPFYLAYSSALLRKNNFDVTTYDGVALNHTTDESFKIACEANADIYLIETTTPTFFEDIKFVKKLKEHHKCIICFSGSHITSFYKEILKEHAVIDYALLAEFEFSLLKLMINLKSDLKNEKIEGVAFYLNNELVDGGKAIHKELDDLPFPDWANFPTANSNPWDYYWDNISLNKPVAQMHSSRGCPFRCDFCVWIQSIYDESKIRTFSPKRVVDEIEELIRLFGVKEIYFDDDNFTGNKKQVLNLCDEMIARGIKIDWSVMGDAMICDEEMIIKMKEAGLVAMKFGVESGDPRVLKEIQKPVNLEKTLKLVKLMNKLKIKAHATFSFGLSGDTLESMGNTLSYMKKLSCDTLQVSISTPLPGTRFYDKAFAKGFIKDVKWSDFDGANTSVISTETLSNLDITNYASKAKRSWLLSKLYDFNWIGRQTYYLYLVFKNQGFSSFFRIIRFGLDIIFS
jgi:anaerobic magnesium-protoporphyrin IX monomethyl ester cyclase